MSLKDTVTGYFANIFGDAIEQAMHNRAVIVDAARDYRKGRQKKQLKVIIGQGDDNVLINYTGLIVDRSISLLFGGGVTYQSDAQDQKEYIERVMDANHEEQLFMALGYYGAEGGNCYLKILPGGVVGDDGEYYTRLVAIDPAYVTIESMPHDKEMITAYIIRYNYIRGNDEVAYKEVISHEYETDADGVITKEWWETQRFELSKKTNGQWQKLDEEPIIFADGNKEPYGFAPISHWQNLIVPDSVYGECDITDDVRGLQDKINFTASNIAKIIKYHAHPKTWGKMLGNKTDGQWGADQMILASDPGAQIANLEMQSDLLSSQTYLQYLRNALMSTTMTVDIAGLDQVGALTNFGLRVLYSDAINKMNVKRELYGDGLEETLRRVLIIGGFEPMPLEIVWEDPLPVNELEASQSDLVLLNAGIISKETVATRRGLNWEDEQTKIAADKTSETNIGAKLLAGFNRGI
jgi:hypothetical protein